MKLTKEQQLINSTSLFSNHNYNSFPLFSIKRNNLYINFFRINDDNSFRLVEQTRLSDNDIKVFKKLLKEKKIVETYNYFDKTNTIYYKVDHSFFKKIIPIIPKINNVELGEIENVYGSYINNKDYIYLNPTLDIEGVSKLSEYDKMILLSIFDISDFQLGEYFSLTVDGELFFSKNYLSDFIDVDYKKTVKKLFLLGVIQHDDFGFDYDGLRESYFKISDIAYKIANKEYIPVKNIIKKESNQVVKKPVKPNKSTNKVDKKEIVSTKSNLKRRDFTGTQKVLLYNLSVLQDNKIFITMKYNHILKKYQIQTDVVDIQYNSLKSLVNKKLLISEVSKDKEYKYFALTKEAYLFGKSLHDYKPQNKDVLKQQIKK